MDCLEAAKNTAKQGGIAAAIVAGITALFAILLLFGVELTSIWASVDAALFALIAFGIFKFSRVAALEGTIARSGMGIKIEHSPNPKGNQSCPLPSPARK